MRKTTFLALALTALSMSTTVSAKQPYGGCWHPDYVKDWTPESDPDAKFNRAKVPLADRFKEPTTMKANQNQYYEGQVANATILYPTCSMCPSQGANNFVGYQPTYWQYMDKLIYWAGSASEGIIIPPPAGTIDAAHQAGVKVLGQIFFPPSYYGGLQSWVRQIVSQEDGKYVYAIKLYEIAKYFGFDGWFINEETGGASTDEWVGFVKEFNKIADENGDSQMEIQWYNASGTPSIDILKAHKNTSQFLEYGSVGDKRGYADQLGCTAEETFSKLYGGIQCVSSGLTGYENTMAKAFPSTGHVGSIDLFCPEEHAWKDNVSSLLNTANVCGEKAYSAITTTFSNEEKMWVNNNGDPSQLASSGWTGISGHVVERSAINAMPFVSNMCVGVGKHRFVEGVLCGTQDWNHSGVQSIMPTWRWWIENRGSLSVAINWDNAYNLGSSIKISNISSGDHLMRLYKTMIPVTNGGVVRVVYQTTGATPELKVSTESSVNPDQTITASSTKNNNGWTVAEYNLSSLNGKTIYMLGLNLKGSVEGYEFSLGQFAVLPASFAPTAVAVSNAAVEATLDEEGGDARLTWDYDWNANFDYFNIYLTNVKGRTLVGQTRDEAFYIGSITRYAGDQSLKFEIVPVMKGMAEGTATVVTADYPALKAPTVLMKPGKSYLTVGETTTLTFTATGYPTQYQWTLPSGLELTEGSLTSQTITVKAVAEGRHNVGLAVTNEVGTTTKNGDIDVYTEEGIASVSNILLNKTVVSYSGCTNSSETPANLIDGITNPTSVSQKWCNVSTDNWVILDTEGLYRIYGFKIYDCKAGPENNENFDSYTIELSSDCKNWETVVNESGREADNIKVDYIIPATARYIRLTPNVSGTLRIWEFEAYGVFDMNMTSEVSTTAMRINAGETQNLVVSYAFNGDERMDDFTCTATVANRTLASIGTIVEDKDNSTFTIPVTALNQIGETTIKVQVVNGPSYIETTVNLVVDSNNAVNMLAGKTAEVRHYTADYSYSAAYNTYNITGLTDGNTTKCALEDFIDDPSTHTDDLWAIFTADDAFNVAKVKVYLPYNNYGTNDNDRDGYINNSIAIAVGNDLSNLNRVKTFSNLEGVSELEYILPTAQKVKYIAVICNLNAYFYPSLAEVEAFEQLESDIVSLDAPLAVTGWTDDVIVEGTPANNFMTNTLDTQGWNFFTSAVQKEGALADDSRIVESAKGTQFKLEPYDQPNALKLSDKTARTLTLVEPVSCESVQILATSADGSGMLNVTLNYTDGTASEAASFMLGDWFGSADDITAKANVYRIFANSASTEYTVDQIDSRSFRVFEVSATADFNKYLQSITVANAGSSIPVVMAVAGKGMLTGIEVPTINSNTNAAVVAIYNLQGMRVANATRGIYIVKYADGTTRKIAVK
jgi:endo-beta-N-acetylglucosaminidase D